MTQIDFLASEITGRYGFVRRARGCFLYTQKGVRLTDLYQEGGRAILGWGGGAFTDFKNALNRGNTGSVDTEFPRRVERAVCELLGSKRTALIFPSRGEALKSALAISADRTGFWRPWNPDSEDAGRHDALIFAPPLPWGEDIYIVAANPELEEISRAAGRNLSKGGRLPAPLLAAIARSIYDLIAAMKVRGEKDWFIYDRALHPYWTRRGPYLFPKVSEKEYQAFILHCLDCQIVISPDFNTPSIVPFGAAEGVFSRLKESPFRHQGLSEGGREK